MTAEAYSVKTILLFNKIDTYEEDALNEVKYLKHVYRKIGYECIGISAKTGENIDKVKHLMKDKVSMFAGHSGVGKSTLINTIEPELDLKTKETFFLSIGEEVNGLTVKMILPDKIVFDRNGIPFELAP